MAHAMILIAKLEEEFERQQDVAAHNGSFQGGMIISAQQDLIRKIKEALLKP
jgi:hypothetical protein